MRRHAPIVAAAALGLLAAASTDALLALVGVARFTGPPLGLLGLPALLLLCSPRVRGALRADRPRTLVAIGAAWTVAPLIDQHLTGAVVIPGTGADLVHHLAGWTALLAAYACTSTLRPLPGRASR